MNQYKKDYPLVPLEEVLEYEKLAITLGISKKCRSKSGWLEFYKQHPYDPLCDDEWRRKRNNFISRNLPKWKKSQSFRKKIMFMIWGFSPSY